jgi:cytochrome o ubiquinol oxidase subunit 1
MIYAVGFLILFVIGGLTGVILANPTIDYQVHNSVFLVAHFHNVLIPGVLYGLLAGYNYWFPKAFGYRLHEGWGRVSALLWIFGFAFTFFPLYFVGLQGMPRRSVSFTDAGFEPYMLVAVFGASLLFSALMTLFIQLWVSVRDREKTRVPLGDPWNGRTLEWAIASPPPDYNFAVIPTITDRDAFAVDKAAGRAYQAADQYDDIELPHNTAIGMVMCIGGTVLGMALVWHIWWLAAVSLGGMLVTLIASTFRTDTHRVIPAAQVAQEHQAWLAQIATAEPVARPAEYMSQNQGLAALEPSGSVA